MDQEFTIIGGKGTILYQKHVVVLVWRFRAGKQEEPVELRVEKTNIFELGQLFTHRMFEQLNP